MKAVYLMALLISTVSVFSGCQKDEFAGLPVLSTTRVTQITGVLMASGGNITSDGGCNGYITWNMLEHKF